MKLRLEGGLLYVKATLIYQRRIMTLDKVIVDTGSIGSVFAADEVTAIGIKPEAGDLIHEIAGIGGSEAVFTRRIDALATG